jgi:malate dehydrogenase (oxaloacetate-decarboxylating)
MDYRFTSDENGLSQVEVSISGYALITHSLLNKGMHFSEEERHDFNLNGLLPPGETTIEEQAVRSYKALQNKATALGKYTYLRELQDSNETLFHYLVNKHLDECMPIIYTPGVGDGCMYFSHIYRRPRGLFISYTCKDYIDQMLANPRFSETEVIVVSDGERILGLGDQGAGGMGIPIGKLCLYTACAGIHPRTTLPILLDTGTDNPELLNDPLYIGWRHERIRGSEYDEFIDMFVKAVKNRFPNVLLQWEDFAKNNAAPLLERYRDQLCTFNDDIQGTAAVAFGTLLAAINVAGTKLSDQKIVIFGAGSAGTGIAELITQAMKQEGTSEEEARARFYLLDRKGLITSDSNHLLDFQKPFAQQINAVKDWKLEVEGKINFKDVVKNAKPTLLIGVSGQGSAFTEEIVREMASHVDRPIIFPLSNPTSKSEAIPTDLLKWTDGKAIIGTGSPFGVVQKNGKSFRIDQTNNSYIFPGMGLGIVAANSKRVTDSMFMAAARALAEASPSKTDPEANLLPLLSKIREISFNVAVAVAQTAVKEGHSDCPLDQIEHRIRQKMWSPDYLPYKKIKSL